MEKLERTVPIGRRLFHAGEDYSARPGSVLIPCHKRQRRTRWVLLVALLAGLWGFGIAAQLEDDPPRAAAWSEPAPEGGKGP